MKAKILILLFIIGIGVLTSCGNDDSSTQNEILNGTWDLKKIYGGFGGTANYEIGDIKWTFNVTTGTIIIENNIMTSSELVSGTYNYRIDQEGEKQILFINDLERGVVIVLSQKKLKIDAGSHVDGFITELEK